MDSLIPVPVAAKELRRPIDSVRRDVISGKLAGERRGARWFVSLSELERIIASRDEETDR